MNVLELTRALIDIESITPNEREIGNFLFGQLDVLARRFEGRAERMPVEEDRDNVFVRLVTTAKGKASTYFLDTRAGEIYEAAAL